ncbi:MAG: EscU/YscU/HrcU family type III secretion system export apparatus switch protein [Pseudomonadota bacterium]
MTDSNDTSGAPPDSDPMAGATLGDTSHSAQARAAALYYSGQGAPVLLAKGVGHKARQIIDVATAHGIPIQQDEQLTGLLCQLPLGDEIPAALYHAVAVVLAHVYMLEDRFEQSV